MSTSPNDRICVVIGRTRHKMMTIEIQEAAKRGAQMIELRLDFLAKAPRLNDLLTDKPCPLVATIRRPDDGGRWSGTEDARQSLMRQAIVSGFDWVDVETDIADSIRRYKNVKRIVSYHNMREVPSNLEEIHAKMCKQDADVVKIAVRSQHPNDNLRVLNLIQDAPKPTVAFCMGDMGLPSRILGARLGSPFTYAAFNKERGLAPGLPSFDEMARVYHYGLVDKDTKVFGVVGDPVGHSLSPMLHNIAMRKVGFNGVYLPFRVPRGELEPFLGEHQKVPVDGYSVTIPHKEAAAAAAREKDETVMRTHAANTLIRQAEGFFATNTDYPALVDSLLANMPTVEGQRPSLASKVVLLLGAGGVARAAAHALHQHGALVTIVNRTPDRASKLAAEVGCRFIEWSARHSVIADLVINCTSVGMHPNLDETPLHHSYLKPGLIVCDLVYTPETTLLIKEAKSRGAHVITGVDMFVRQAALQFKLFTGRDAPLELMRSVMRKVLSPVTPRAEEA